MQGAGSGFIIDPSGIIVTNNHVVGHADKIVVSLTDGTELPARVVGTRRADRRRASSRSQANRPLPAVTWGDSRAVEVGDWMLAAGNPFGLGGSVTAGIVSARGRDIGAGPFDDFLQTRRADQPGQLRRPAVQHGRRGDRHQHGDRLALRRLGRHRLRHPERDGQPIVDQLRNGGRIERGWLGVSVAGSPSGGRRRVDRRGGAQRPGGAGGRARRRHGDGGQRRARWTPRAA